MRISLFVAQSSQATHWLVSLQQALPKAELSIWSEHTKQSSADYAIVWRPTQAFVDSQPKLKAMFNAGAGVDAIMKLTLPTQCKIVRLEDAGMGTQMAEYVTFAALRHYREFDAYEQHARRGEWKPHAPRRITEFPVGILGYGILAEPVVNALTALGFSVHAWTRSQRASSTTKLFCGEDGLVPFLNATRILVCMLPLTPETRYIIRAQTIAQLQPDAYIINVARGGHFNESDLLAALDAGLLAGVTTDVCEVEPAVTDHPFWRHPKVFLTPHIAASTLIEESVAQIALKIKALERGDPITGMIDRQRGY